MFINKLNELSAWFKFSAAVGSTNTNPQDCEMFEYIKKINSTTTFEDKEHCELFEGVTADFVSA